MKHLFNVMVGILALTISSCSAPYSFLKEEEVKLSKPSPIYGNIFFKKEAIVKTHNQDDDIETFYGINSSRDMNALLSDSIMVSQSCILYTQNRKKGFIASDIDSVKFIDITSARTMEMRLNSRPHDSYKGQGAATLVNMLKGSTNFRDGQWLGFDAGVVNMDVNLDGSSHRKGELLFSFMRDHNAWIFHPESVDITYLIHDQPIAFETLLLPQQNIELNSDFVFISANIPDKEFDKISISIKSPKAIPSWHAGAGTTPWIFIDEILWLEK